MSKKAYRVLVFSFFSVLLVLGIYLGFIYENSITVKTANNKIVTDDKEKDDSQIDIYENIKPVTVNIYTEDITVEIIYKYLTCNEQIKETKVEYQTSMQSVKDKYSDFEVLSDDNNILQISKEIATNCPNHFLVKSLDDYVAIFKVINKDVEEVFKNTEIHINTLVDEVKLELENGIYIDGIIELNRLIEDLES